MPSKDNKEISGGSEYYPPEVEDLVAAIHHNLQLKSRPRMAVCGHHHHKQQRRVSPYTVPPPVRRTLCHMRTNTTTTSSSSSSNNNNSCTFDVGTYCRYCNMKSPIMVDNRTDDNDDDNPYDMLQDLIREGSLIKEAVKRLQLGLNCTKPRKTDFYDLEEIDATSPRL